jgi:hypothetical protein
MHKITVEFICRAIDGYKHKKCPEGRTCLFSARISHIGFCDDMLIVCPHLEIRMTEVIEEEE